MKRDSEEKELQEFAEDPIEQKNEEIDNIQESEEGGTKKKRSFLAELLSWVIPIVIAVVVALFIKNYVLINATVPTGSMLNTIYKGDNLFGLRMAYKFSDPKRGDIVIFDAPDKPGTKYIKRIIGEPGDKVVVKKGKIYINDAKEPLEEDYLREEWTVMNDKLEYQVPEGHYLMFGDNRNDSLDARYWENKYVSRDAIIAKAWFVYYPFNHFHSL